MRIERVFKMEHGMEHLKCSTTLRLHDLYRQNIPFGTWNMVFQLSPPHNK